MYLQSCSSPEKLSFVIDRLESYSATNKKNCIFIAQKKLRTVWTYFSVSLLTQVKIPDVKILDVDLLGKKFIKTTPLVHFN